ncbi:ABC transporter permease [Sinosporangium siamense]|uniref:Transport permease protein n=1 Tax=Sinosporangium siamense TaxID=1367973 RepID=A0A919RAB6_9ACTN|nr:ABC transporter permease [Sinosporangium siamense]GII89862.1 transport permease protein [Sinosporangium siamense]
MKVIRDTRTMFIREITPALRQPVGLLFTMGQPLLFLFLFGPLLAGNEMFAAQGEASAWQWFVPGILIMMCITGPMMAGYMLLMELVGGSMERMLVTPMSRTAMMIGRTLKEIALLLVQAVLLIGLALPLGFRLYLPGVLAGLILLVVLGVGLGAFSFALAIASQPGGELFYMVTQAVMFPLILLSGMLLPLDSGPTWLQVLGRINPVSYIVDAERMLFAGTYANPSVLYGSAAALLIAAVGVTIGTRSMRRGI